MKSLVAISQAVELVNNRVKPFQGEKRYLATGDLLESDINSFTNVDYETKPSRADLLVDEGDIIVARMQSTDKVLLIEKETKDLIVSTGFLILKPREKFSAKYLMHYFKSTIFQSQKDKYCSGATQKAINNESFYKLKVPYYPLEEQTKISDILEKADSLRQKRKQAIQMLDDFILSTFNDYFSRYFIERNIFQPISEVTEYIDYRGKTPEKSESGIPLITAKNVKKGFFDIFPQEFVSDDIYKKLMTRGFPKSRDLLFTTEGATLANVCLVPDYKEFAVGQRLITLIAKKNITTEYMLYYFQTKRFRDEVFKRATGSAAKGIRSAEFYKIMIPVPPIDLQNKFKAIVINTDIIKNNMKNSLLNIDDQFNALMQKYFG